MSQMAQRDVAESKFSLSEREEVFDQIVASFKQAYAWWGEQLSREALISLATHNIETDSTVERSSEYTHTPRVRRHLMVYAPRGWYKSTVMEIMAKLVGDDPENGRVGKVGTVSEAAFRGTVNDNGDFVPPEAMTKDILFFDEFGTVATDEDLLQVMNQLMESGEATVNLSKIASMGSKQQYHLEQKYNRLKFVNGELDKARKATPGEDIDFDEIGSASKFYYQSKPIMWACTYKQEHIQDAANASRWSPVFMKKKPTAANLTKHVNRNSFSVNEDTIRLFRQVLNDTGIPSDADSNKLQQALAGDLTAVQIPERFYDENPEMDGRMSAQIKQYILGLRWWGKDPSDRDIDQLVDNITRLNDMAEEGEPETAIGATEQLIIDSPLKVKHIAEKTGYSKKRIYDALEEIEESIYGDPTDDRIVDFDRDDSRRVIWTSKGQKTAYEST